MKKLFTFLITFLSLQLVAQNTITGVVLDEETGESLVGASVYNVTSATGTVTDFDGSFELTNVSLGPVQLRISYTGYAEQEINVDVKQGVNDVSEISLGFESIGLSEVSVIASVAVDRKTPVAVSTIDGGVIEERLGNKEFPEILKSTPSIYATKQGGGFGDSRINVRGFNQRNVAVMINGIPVNDMENGWVYWSNWAGLSDVTSTMQVQRGLGATKLAAPTVGGSINIITNPAEFEKGGTASVSLGNDGYLKGAFSYSTGQSQNGWAASFQATHTRGNGYVDGTQFRAYSYFAAISKSSKDGDHLVSLTALGAPQWHHQRNGASRFDGGLNLRTFYDPDNTGEEGTNLGIRYNHTWGMLNGEEFNFRRNFYHKPKAFINHYWNISSKTDLKTSAYVSLGRGGGTGPRGRLRTPGSIFDSFGGINSGIHDGNGLVRFDDLVRYNQGQSVSGWGDPKQQENGQYTVTSDGRFYFPGGRNNNGSGFIRRASMNSHNWFGVLSTLTQEINSNLDFVAGIDWRYYKGIHYRRLENLLGAQGYLSRSDDNNPANLIKDPSPAKFGNFADNSYKEGNVLNYWNDGLVNWFGAFAQIEYSTDNLTVFTSVSGSNQGFKRIDYFNYAENDPQRESDWENFLGGTIKAGLNYNIDGRSNIFINGGAYSRQPVFDNVFINFVNEVNPDIENQKVYAFEAGYGYRGSGLRLNLNVYNTVWTDRQFDRGFDLADDEEGLALFRGVGQTHRGVELELSYEVSQKLGFDFMTSIGDWRYNNDFTASIQNIDTQQPAGEATIFANDLHIDDAAQTTLNFSTRYEIVPGLRLFGTFYHAARLYAQYDIADEQFLKPGGEVIKLPSYSLVDLGATYNFKLGNTNTSLRMSVDNVGNTKYISEAFTNIPDDPSTSNINELYNNRGFIGFGTTWHVGYKIWF